MSTKEMLKNSYFNREKTRNIERINRNIIKWNAINI